ncbi:MAG: hypothetical protein GC136_04490 [Alphaproteobacteria bacterium]|nr:hypothetical protein [Alphaproteobacteria bacterium]
MIIKFTAGLLIVLALMGLLALGLRWWNEKRGFTTPLTGKDRRLRIVEVLMLDTRHKAVLLQRDGTEHLVILGPNGETVVESNIQKPL